MPEDRLLPVRSNVAVGDFYHLLSLDIEGEAPAWEPGQFAMIAPGGVAGRSDPLLRRPFSIYNLCAPAPGSRHIEILYKVHGRGTALMASLKRADRVACLFPLGRGFDPGLGPRGRLVLAAGGAGIASLHPLAAAEVRAGRSPLLLFGARTAAELPAAAATRELGVETLVSTDDGSEGHHGFVSELLDLTLREERPGAERIVCACGPMPMMKATARVAASHGTACHVSLESTMACGFGVCVGCVVGARLGEGEPVTYLRTCVDGPVMDASGIVW